MNDIKLALWKNDKRDKPTQPILKGGKPQLIEGQEYWVSAWINTPKDASPELRQKIEDMVEYLANANDRYPIVSVSLSPAGEHTKTYAKTPPPGDTFSDDIPFAPVGRYE